MQAITVIKSPALVGMAWGRWGQGVSSRIPSSGTLVASREQGAALMCKPSYVPGAPVVRKPVFPQVCSPLQILKCHVGPDDPGTPGPAMYAHESPRPTWLTASELGSSLNPQTTRCREQGHHRPPCSEQGPRARGVRWFTQSASRPALPSAASF